ncbi:MAG TPA: L-seryl-tRNA(Sec) selenium transferase [Gemmatimonadaceae bacterium]|jgi:L-seryl-tRNA(Ser) seleniumtransferase|nr:L-seryl-tRNA(Sec) selenium transferase [Gemmatimonadaceae bacterium]
MADRRRSIPSVNTLLELAEIRQLTLTSPRELVADAVRGVLEEVRLGGAAPESDAEWAGRISNAVSLALRPSLRQVLNGTGVVLHTNLGRAPLADAAVTAIRRIAAGYTNLEYDLTTGHRGSRHAHCVRLLRELTGADDALVVNNGAAAVLLALNTVADGHEVIVSRGELVEIGGSFRVPEVMGKSGARLVEVGTTNRTHVADYERAITPATAAMAKIHRSNFAMDGFVAEVRVEELVRLAAPRGLSVLHDLGSGLLVDLARVGLTGEPTAMEAVRAGATLVTMSGDKLLGGPQAGIILGRADTIARVRANPLTRAVRVDKLTLAALGATLSLYRDPERAFAEVPTLRMLGATVQVLTTRAGQILTALPASAEARVVESEATVGGGAYPTARLPSVALSLGGDATALEARLRAGDPVLVGRMHEGRLLVDLRAIPERDDRAVVGAIARALDA